MAEPATRLEEFAAGDPLRALAALAVMALHGTLLLAGARDIIGERIYHAVLPLSVAVNVFLVLSGYLIARPFVRAYLADAQMPDLGRYLRRRASRILPLYWAVLTVLLLARGSLGSSSWGVLGTYGFLQYLGNVPAGYLLPQGWSIVVEVGFYLAVPLAAFALWSVGLRVDPGRRLPVISVALGIIWLLSALMRTWAPTRVGPFFMIEITLPAYLWAFVPGIALAVIEQSPARAWAGRRAARALPAALLVVALLSYGGMVSTGTSSTVSRSILLIVLATLVSGAVVAAPLVLQWSGRPCWRWLDNRPLLWIGARSYSVYMIHTGVLQALSRPVARVAAGWTAVGLVMLLAVPWTLVFAHISYELIEQPFLRRRLPWRRPVPNAVATA